METNRTLDGRHFIPNPPFLQEREKEKEGIMTLYSKNLIEVGDILLISGFRKIHPKELSFKIEKIIENRDHAGFISVTDINYGKDADGKVIKDYTLKSEPEKKKKSFYKVKVSAI